MSRQARILAALLVLPSLMQAHPAAAQNMAPLPPPAPSYAVPPSPPPYPPPAVAPPTPARSAQAEEVRFEPTEPGLRLLALSGETLVERYGYYRYGWYPRMGVAPMYSPICDGPCTTGLGPGAYRVALGRGDGRAVPVPEPLVVEGPTAVRGYYTDRSGLRAAGWVVGVGGAVGGVVMVIASANGPTVCDDAGYCHAQVDGALLGGGIGVILATGIVGSILAFQRDEAHITVEPLRLSSVGTTREAPLAALGAARPPQGAALTMSF